jgi:hypothetical protein
VVITREWSFLFYASRAKKYDRVLDFFLVKMGERPQVLRENAERAGIRALEERFLSIRKRTPHGVRVRIHRHGA